MMSPIRRGLRVMCCRVRQRCLSSAAALQPPAPSTPPQPLPDHPAALAWMDTHHSHLLAAQHTAAGHHRHQAVWHLAWTLTAFHRRRGHRHDELAVWQAATDAADHLPAAARTLAHRRPAAPTPRWGGTSRPSST